MLIHIPEQEKRFQCSVCDFATIYSDSWKKHEIRHKGEKSLKCNQCNFVTFFQDGLKSHMKRHNGEKSYNCRSCDYATPLGHTWEESTLTKRIKNVTSVEIVLLKHVNWRLLWKFTARKNPSNAYFVIIPLPDVQTLPHT